MLILLPPSEGKSAAEEGSPVDLASLSFPSLTSTRRKVLAALIRLCRGDVSVAATTLALGQTQRGEVGANARLRREPCAPAIDVYTGVLYEALDHRTLSPSAHRRLDEQVAIASALWGLVRPSDLIPAYRLSGGVTLPGIGTMAGAWRERVGRVLDDTEGLIVDLRSSTYVGLGPLSRPAAARAATVRVLTERDGKRTVVSHSNKATKGRIVRALVESRRAPTDPDALADLLHQADYRVEVPAARAGHPTVIDVIVDHV